MGFTPLEGLVTATRSGTVDPGLALWLQEHGVATAELAWALEGTDFEISHETASVRTLVMQAREDLQVSREVDATL